MHLIHFVTINIILESHHIYKTNREFYGLRDFKRFVKVHEYLVFKYNTLNNQTLHMQLFKVIR